MKEYLFILPAIWWLYVVISPMIKHKSFFKGIENVNLFQMWISCGLVWLFALI